VLAFALERDRQVELDARRALEVSWLPSSYEAWFIDNFPQATAWWDRYNVGTRLLGGGSLVFGGIEAYCGATFAVLSAPTVVGAVIGAVVAAHGIDLAQAGLRQFVGGEEVRTYTSQYLGSGLELLGVPQGQAQVWADRIDMGISIVGTLGTGFARAAVRKAIERCLRLVRSASPTAAAVRGAVSAEMQGTRLGGELYGEGQLARLESYLGRRNVRLIRNADEFLDAEGANGMFRAKANGTGKLYLRSSPTQYEVMHELKHFRDFRTLGFDEYEALQRVGREQSVFDLLSGPRRWSMLNQAEKDHAFRYILSLDGNPFGVLP
jgi:hypothetical protein